MRLRIAAAASMFAALVAIVIPGAATARNHQARHHHKLTINAFPNPASAPEGVLIYGRLLGSNNGNQTIRLYHHIAGGKRGFQYVTSVKTDSFGNWDIPRADGVVMTNRDWFVRGPDRSRSRTMHEKVAAEVSISPAGPVSVTTGQRVVFTGKVAPNHAFQRVRLQEETGTSGDWHTLKTALLGPGSGYAVAYTWKVPGVHDVRVELPADARNIRSDSDAVTVQVQQKQVTGFTIDSSQPILPYGQSVTISGTITPGGTAQPATVELWAHPTTGGPFTEVGTTNVGSGGSYSFSEAPTVNTIYQARTTFGAVKHSAELWQGVRDVLTLTPSTTSTTVGGLVTFNGTIAPTTKSGDVVYLERLGSDNDWHPVEARFVQSGGTFRFAWRFGKAGSYQFRARIFSDRANVGGASTPVTISVSGLAPISTLPPAS
jgi:hypothetical protein